MLLFSICQFLFFFLNLLLFGSVIIEFLFLISFEQSSALLEILSKGGIYELEFIYFFPKFCNLIHHCSITSQNIHLLLEFMIFFIQEVYLVFKFVNDFLIGFLDVFHVHFL